MMGWEINFIIFSNLFVITSDLGSWNGVVREVHLLLDCDISGLDFMMS
jgi:hypothetical protein